MTHLWTAVGLLADLLWHVVIAGVTTAWWIVRPGRRVSPVVVRVRYQAMSPGGAVVYACLLSLTPGTTAIDVDVETRTLVLHVLDGRQAPRAMQDVRQRFERRLQVLFPDPAA